MRNGTRSFVCNSVKQLNLSKTEDGKVVWESDVINIFKIPINELLSN